MVGLGCPTSIKTFSETPWPIWALVHGQAGYQPPAPLPSVPPHALVMLLAPGEEGPSTAQAQAAAGLTQHI